MTAKTTRRLFRFSSWGCIPRHLVIPESAYLRLDGVDTESQAAARSIERTTGIEVINMREDSHEQAHGEIVSTTYEITLGRTLYRYSNGHRYSDGASVDGRVWISIPRD